MPETAFVAGDWGTSHLRLFLCRGQEVLERRNGPGIGSVGTDPAAVLFDCTASWTRAHGRLPVWLAGMVGSRNGWQEVPYVPCPVDADALAAGMLRFAAQGHDITIMPGVSCTNPCGAPDVMRGEETQIIGALARDRRLAVDRHVLVLPGTHTKWVLIDHGRIMSFQTSLSGELYALLCHHSTLLRVSNAASGSVANGSKREDFARGLTRSRELANVPLMHLLFEVRSRQLAAQMSHEAARDFLSGLIIGHDVLGGLTLFKDALRPATKLELIGAPELTHPYSLAFASHGIEARAADATELTLAGLRVLANRVPIPDSHRAIAT